MKKNKRSIRALNVKPLENNKVKMILGGADSEVAVQEIELAIESWTQEYSGWSACLLPFQVKDRL